MKITVCNKIKAITYVSNVLIGAIPWMINVVNGLSFLMLGFFL